MADELLLDRWKSSLLTAPDAKFFQIMRIYLGDVKTPFNKHDLIRRLTAFLRKPETANRILSLVDSRDAKVLTAIVLLEEPTMSRLHSLFEDAIGYLALHYHVLNLEERMLVYRDDSTEHSHIRLHPLLANTVHATVVNPALIYRYTAHDPVHAHLSLPTDARIVAAASYIIGTSALLKSDGELRKKAIAEIAERFSEDKTGTNGEGIRAMAAGLGRIGAVTEKAGEFRLNISRWRSFCTLDSKSRMAHLICRAAFESHNGNEHAAAIAELLEQMPVDRSTDEESVYKMLKAFSVTEIHQHRVESIIRILETFGLLSRVSRDDLIRTTSPVVAAESTDGAVIQPTFELHIPINIDAGSIWFLPIICELSSFDTVSRYEITRAACARGFDAGFDAETIIDLLDELCANTVPSNIRTTLMLWEQEFRGIRMVRGTVVLVDESRRHLFEYDERIQELIHETLRPGVYLIRSKDIEALRKHLEQVGIDPLPDIVMIDDSAEDAGDSELRLNRLAAISPDPLIHDSDTHEIGNPEPADALSQTVDRVSRDAYRDDVESYAGVERLSNAERLELEERIERRLILFPHQIASIQPISEIVEAKGFDYLGKVRLIEQAIAHGNDLLEITRIDDDGKPVRHLIKPDTLTNNASELILVGRAMAGEKQIEFRVRTIGVVRKRRGSMLR